MVVKIGILGCGRMGQRHAEAYSKIPDANVVAFADIDIHKAEILAERFQKKYVLVSALFTDPSIDAISICTPNSLHFENSIAALKNGKHVLVEKPMALSLSDCDEMNRVAKENNLNLMVGQTYRYYPSSQKAKEIIDSGEIGEIKLIMGYGLDPGFLPGKTKTPDWALNQKFGGGVFFDAIHGIDLLRYWTGSEISSVYVPIMDKLFDDFSAEQLGIATITFSNNVVATIMPVAPTWGIRDTGIKIIGKKGALYVTYGEEVKVGKQVWKNYDFTHKSIPASYEHNLQGFINEFSEFIASILENRPPEVTGYEGKKNLEVILAMYESFAKKEIIKINKVI